MWRGGTICQTSRHEADTISAKTWTWPVSRVGNCPFDRRTGKTLDPQSSRKLNIPKTVLADRLLGVEFDAGRLGFRVELLLPQRWAGPLPRGLLQPLPRLVCASFRSVPVTSRKIANTQSAALLQVIAVPLPCSSVPIRGSIVLSTFTCHGRPRTPIRLSFP